MKNDQATQHAIQAAKDYLRGNGPWKDSEILVEEDDYLVTHFAKAIKEAERRGMERAAGIAKVAWLQGGLNSPLDADEAMTLCEGIAQAIRQAAKEQET